MKFILAILCLSTVFKNSLGNLTDCDDRVSYSIGDRCYEQNESTKPPKIAKPDPTNATFPLRNNSSGPNQEGATELRSEENESSDPSSTTTPSKNGVVDERKNISSPVVPVNDSERHPDPISQQNLTAYILQISGRFNFVSFLYFLDKNFLCYALGGSIFDFLENEKETMDRNHYIVAVGLYFSALNHCLTYSVGTIAFIFKKCIKTLVRMLTYAGAQTVLAIQKSYFYCRGRKEDLGGFKSYLEFHKASCVCCNCDRFGPFNAVSALEYERLRGENATLRSQLRIAEHKLPEPHQLITTVLHEPKSDLFFPPASNFIQRQEKLSLPTSSPSKQKTATINGFPQMKYPWKSFNFGGKI